MQKNNFKMFAMHSSASWPPWHHSTHCILQMVGRGLQASENVAVNHRVLTALPAHPSQHCSHTLTPLGLKASCWGGCHSHRKEKGSRVSTHRYFGIDHCWPETSQTLWEHVAPNFDHLKSLFATSTFTFHGPKQAHSKRKVNVVNLEGYGHEGKVKKMETNSIIYFTSFAYDSLNRRIFFILCF